MIAAFSLIFSARSLIFFTFAFSFARYELTLKVRLYYIRVNAKATLIEVYGGSLTSDKCSFLITIKFRACRHSELALLVVNSD